MNSCSFKLSRAYSNSFNSSNVGKFYLELNSKRLLKFRKRKRKSLSCVYVVQKKVMHVQSCRFANLNLSLFFLSSLPSPPSSYNRDLKTRGRRRQRKRRCVVFFQSSSRLLQVTNFVKCRRTPLKLNS